MCDSIVVSIPRCHRGDRGSIPRRAVTFFFDIIFGEARARGGGGGGFGTHGNDGVAPARQAGDSEQRRCQGRSGRPRGGEQGDEAEESPSNKGAMRARGEATFELQGV